MKLVRYADLPAELQKCDPCNGCPRSGMDSDKGIGCNDLPCIKEAKEKDLESYSNWYYFDELTYFTWRLKK